MPICRPPQGQGWIAPSTCGGRWSRVRDGTFETWGGWSKDGQPADCPYKSEHPDQTSPCVVCGLIGGDQTLSDGAVNTHYAVIVFGGDPASEHEDESLRGQGPSLTFIACGPEQFCWDAVAAWTSKHPLRRWEDVEVLTRDPSVVRVPQQL